MAINGKICAESDTFLIAAAIAVPGSFSLSCRVKDASGAEAVRR
jgi:hypothetical protein